MQLAGQPLALHECRTPLRLRVERGVRDGDGRLVGDGRQECALVLVECRCPAVVVLDDAQRATARVQRDDDHVLPDRVPQIGVQGSVHPVAQPLGTSRVDDGQALCL
jgi:hypothetical protein